MVGYSHEKKGYKCYNPQTKQVRVSRDVVFNETLSQYLVFPSNRDSIPINEDEASEPEMIREEEEEEYGTLEESLIS